VCLAFEFFELLRTVQRTVCVGVGKTAALLADVLTAASNRRPARPLVILLDDLAALRYASYGSGLSSSRPQAWLPASLPPGVAFILTCSKTGPRLPLLPSQAM